MDLAECDAQNLALGAFFFLFLAMDGDVTRGERET